MSDIQSIELAIRRVMASMQTTGAPEWFAALANELAKMQPQAGTPPNSPSPYLTGE